MTRPRLTRCPSRQPLGEEDTRRLDGVKNGWKGLCEHGPILWNRHAVTRRDNGALLGHDRVRTHTERGSQMLAQENDDYMLNI